MKSQSPFYSFYKKFKVHPQNYVGLIFLLSMLLTGCQTKPQNENNPQSQNRSYFSFDSKEDAYLLIPIFFNDTIVANMIFDTAPLNALNIDSTFYKKHSALLCNTSPASIDTLYQSSWSYQKKIFSKYKTQQNIKIGTTAIGYDRIFVTDYKNTCRNSRIDGLFGIPKNDTTHIWELNFENNYLEVHDIHQFKIPDNCHWLPICNDNPYLLYALLTLKIKTQDGDTLTIKRPFLIDTGVMMDVVLLKSSPEVKFFDKKEAVWISFIGTYYKRYTIEDALLDTLPLEDLRVYTFDEAFQLDESLALIGLNFLKRFNVFFDMKNNRIGLQPIKNFKRLTLPLLKRFHLSIKEVNGKYLITKIADYKTNDYKIAGLQEGDEVTAVNGIPYAKTREKDAPLMKKDTLVFDILRQNKPMKITVIPDPNEPKGD